MSSEWEKKCPKAVLAGNKSRTQMEQLGIKRDNLTKSIKHVVDVASLLLSQLDQEGVTSLMHAFR